MAYGGSVVSLNPLDKNIRDGETNTADKAHQVRSTSLVVIYNQTSINITHPCSVSHCSVGNVIMGKGENRSEI